MDNPRDPFCAAEFGANDTGVYDAQVSGLFGRKNFVDVGMGDREERIRRRKNLAIAMQEQHALNNSISPEQRADDDEFAFEFSMIKADLPAFSFAAVAAVTTPWAVTSPQAAATTTTMSPAILAAVPVLAAVFVRPSTTAVLPVILTPPQPEKELTGSVSFSVGYVDDNGVYHKIENSPESPVDVSPESSTAPKADVPASEPVIQAQPSTSSSAEITHSQWLQAAYPKFDATKLSISAVKTTASTPLASYFASHAPIPEGFMHNGVFITTNSSDIAMEAGSEDDNSYDEFGVDEPKITFEPAYEN